MDVGLNWLGLWYKFRFLQTRWSVSRINQGRNLLGSSRKAPVPMGQLSCTWKINNFLSYFNNTRHFDSVHSHFSLIFKLKTRKCCGHYLPILRNRCTITVLIGIAYNYMYLMYIVMLVCAMLWHIPTWQFTRSIKYFSLLIATRYTNLNRVRVAPPEDRQVMAATCRGFEF
jgi:hypothetical protein